MAQAILTSCLAVGFAILNCWFIFLSFRTDLVTQFERINSVSSSSSSSSINVVPANTDVSPPPEVVKEGSAASSCDLFKGHWIPDAGPPLYTNETCEYIHPNQNCMKNGRPDLGYLHWRWKPDECQLAGFDPARFLDLTRNKRLAFIGDSLGRNHMQSLLCALVQAEKPEMIGHFKYSDLEEWWRFPLHNFTLRNIWTPFLVKYTSQGELFSLHLDVLEDVWSTHLEDVDIAILGIGYWYFRPSVYYTNGTVLGCSPRSGLNFPRMEELSAFRIAHQNALSFLLHSFKGLVMLRTITVDHFEHGSWDGGGLCNRTGPFTDSGMAMPWMGLQMYQIQKQEFHRVAADASNFHLLDVSFSSFMRPDGHPSFYRIQKPNERPQYDCLHWCLPGPIDMWNQAILRMLQN